MKTSRSSPLRHLRRPRRPEGNDPYTAAASRPEFVVYTCAIHMMLRRSEAAVLTEPPGLSKLRTTLRAGRAMSRPAPLTCSGNAPYGKPEENGFAERLMRTIREEEIDLSECRDFADAYGQTPAESVHQWLREQSR